MFCFRNKFTTAFVQMPEHLQPSSSGSECLLEVPQHTVLHCLEQEETSLSMTWPEILGLQWACAMPKGEPLPRRQNTCISNSYVRLPMWHLQARGRLTTVFTTVDLQKKTSFKFHFIILKSEVWTPKTNGKVVLSTTTKKRIKNWVWFHFLLLKQEGNTVRVQGGVFCCSVLCVLVFITCVQLHRG